MGTQRSPKRISWAMLGFVEAGELMFRISSLVLMAVLFALPGCKSAPRNHRAEVVDTVSQLEALIETRNLRELKARMVSDYRDFRGQSKAEAIRFIQFQFLKRQTIGLVTHIQHVELSAPPTQAEVKLIVGAGSTPATDFKTLSGLSAELFEVDLELTDDDGQWNLTGAAWKRIRFSQLNALLEKFDGQ